MQRSRCASARGFISSKFLYGFASNRATRATLNHRLTAGAGMRARSLRTIWLAVALFPLGAAAVPPQALRIGAAAERPMTGGESQAYRIERIEAKPGTRLLVTVDQRGIDVVVE